MRPAVVSLVPFALPFALALAGCSKSSSPSAPPLPAEDDACAGPCPQSSIKHVVVIVQENQTFDTHFGKYCTAPAGSSPTCNDGPACCEAIPAADPSGAAPATLDDALLGNIDPDHTQACESAEIDDGGMDRFASGPACAAATNVAVADPSVIKPYWDYAATGALADRYFQPVVGESYANDMYLARAQFAFTDNVDSPQGAVGVTCSLLEGAQSTLTGATVGDLLTGAGVPWTFFAEGYAAMATANAADACAPLPADCPFGLPVDPCVFEPSDVPFEFYASTRDVPAVMKDLAAFESALDDGGLPAVSFVKAIEYKTEHPGFHCRLSDGVAFVTGVVDHVLASRYRGDTLVVLVYDEGGGYYDHVAPPPPSTVDQQPYGTRVPLLAMGPFAKKNYVSHVVMEHSSLVKFIEWNWLGGKTGQLGGRDAVVANIGDLLDPSATGAPVPAN